MSWTLKFLSSPPPPNTCPARNCPVWLASIPPGVPGIHSPPLAPSHPHALPHHSNASLPNPYHRGSLYFQSLLVATGLHSLPITPSHPPPSPTSPLTSSSLPDPFPTLFCPSRSHPDASRRIQTPPNPFPTDHRSSSSSEIPPVGETITAPTAAPIP